MTHLHKSEVRYKGNKCQNGLNFARNYSELLNYQFNLIQPNCVKSLDQTPSPHPNPPHHKVVSSG